MHTVQNGMLIGMGIGVVLFVIVSLWTRVKFWGWTGWITVGLLFGVVLGGLVGEARASANGYNLPQHRVVASSQKLVSLHVATGIEFKGSFLGWDSSSPSEYVCYVQTPDGIERSTYNTDNAVHKQKGKDLVYLVLDAPPGTGYIDTMQWAFDNPADGDWAHPRSDQIIQIHVPPDSIAPDFKVNN